MTASPVITRVDDLYDVSVGSVADGQALVRSGSNWVPATVAKGLVPTAVKTADYTAAAGDFVPVDTTSGNVTVTLPTAPAEATRVGVKMIGQASSHTVTISRGGTTDVFNKTGGVTSATLTLLNQAVSLQYKASSGIWYVVADDVPLSGLDARYVSSSGGSLPADRGLTNFAGRTILDNPLPGIVSLISGSDDETPIASNCTAAADTTNFKVGDRGWLMTSTASSGFMNLAFDPPSPQTVSASPLTVPAWQALCMWIYIPDVTKFVTNDVSVFLYTDDALNNANRWGKGCTQFGAQTLVNGWNFIRIPANAGYLNAARRGIPTAFNSIYRVTVSIQVNAVGAAATVGHVFLETRPKASVMCIADRGYQTFIANAYPLLKAAGIPVTFALDTTLMGTGSGDSTVMSQATLDGLAVENGNSISFHGYDGSATSAMTAAQLRADTLKAIKFCQSKGYTGRMWRAAFVQNNAAQWAAIRNYVIAARSGVTADADLWQAWPPSPDANGVDLMRISPRAMDDGAGGSAHRTTADLDTYFTFAQQAHGLDVFFFHGINGTGTFDTTQTLFNYWLAKVTAGIAAGWLEAVTFEDLFYRAGGRFSNLGGSSVATYLNPDGTQTTKYSL